MRGSRLRIGHFSTAMMTTIVNRSDTRKDQGRKPHRLAERGTLRPLHSLDPLRVRLRLYPCGLRHVTFGDLGVHCLSLGLAFGNSYPDHNVY